MKKLLDWLRTYLSGVTTPPHAEEQWTVEDLERMLACEEGEEWEPEN
jgi:hypothetical protein